MANIFLGLLSGTSIDSIDCGAFIFTNNNIQFIQGYSKEIPTDLRNNLKQITATNESNCSIETMAELDITLGELFAATVNEFLAKYNIDRKKIAAIGCHGQTIKHVPNKKNKSYSIQIANPNIITEHCQINVIADFRTRDIVAGGQGAPLAPAFHAVFFQDSNENRAIVNVGGISNITILNNKDKPFGYDTGPGNCILDLYCQKHFNIPFDKDGLIAKQGTIIPELLTKMLLDPYFKIQSPKSTGPEYFNLNWLNSFDITKEQPKNIVATLTALTAQSIVDNSKNLKLYICGGGSNNNTLMQQLEILSNSKIETTTKLGLDPKWVEAGLFAWLAKQTLERKVIDLTAITGAKTPTILGATYYA